MTLSSHRVLIITGGLITAHETSIWNVLRKLIIQGGHSRHGWFEFVVKSLVAEPLIGWQLEKLLLPIRSSRDRKAMRTVLKGHRSQSVTSSLTEVLLATLLEKAGLEWEATTLDELFAHPGRAKRRLARAGCVFLSSTYLHDLSELEPVLHRLKRPHNRIVLGGALAGTLPPEWEGDAAIDIVAIGYGELLIDSIASWIKSDYRVLGAPAHGRIQHRTNSVFLYSGTPPTRSLDALPRPDWRLAAHDRNSPGRMIYYESVRGCPYRCNFCNYPFLFDDTVFRYRSAARMAEDWEHYVNELGVEYITCLDSLFTMPRPRLHEFCGLLIERKIGVKWICYARADDLADERTVVLMKSAGAHQVHVGIESGDKTILKNMNKACSIESNRAALLNCRKHGLTTIASLIAGFPGETKASLQRTYEFLETAPPDFYFLIPFSTRVSGVPLLTPENRRRFGLRVMQNLHTLAPYWEHDTMSCSEVGLHARAMERKLMGNRIALNAALFFPMLHEWRPATREDCLNVQARVADGHPLLKLAFNRIHSLLNHKIKLEAERFIPQKAAL